MNNRRLHPREEPYRWAIEKLDEAFGLERVRITPRNHYHVITATTFSETGERSDDLVLRNPTEDLNKRKDREKYLDRWISEVQARFAPGKQAVPKK
jgi:predicted GH43/DUF377 family glycosyl hydrolase